MVIHWLIFPYPLGLLHWHCGNLTIAPVPAKQPWWIWINTSCEFIMNDCITTTKQSTTKPCAYFLGYTVSRIWISDHIPENSLRFIYLSMHYIHASGTNFLQHPSLTQFCTALTHWGLVRHIFISETDSSLVQVLICCLTQCLFIVNSTLSNKHQYINQDIKKYQEIKIKIFQTNKLHLKMLSAEHCPLNNGLKWECGIFSVPNRQ